MITSPLLYIFTLAIIATGFHFIQKQTQAKVFEFVPAVVFIYIFSMVFASIGAFEQNEAINELYKLAKINLLPAMLFLMLLQVDLRSFRKLGSSLITAYVFALFTLACGFVAVGMLFGFSQDEAGAFGALAGSWMGGTANMVAVGSALEVSEKAFGYALIVDSVNYTFWVMLLLFLVPFAHIFNHFTKADAKHKEVFDVGCSCEMGAKRYWSLIALALVVSIISQVIAESFVILNKTTTIVLLATLLGLAGSFTKLRSFNGSSEVATTMLYLLVALIGSRAVFESFSGLGMYVLAGFLILLIHAVGMIIVAKLFKLDLFSIAIASLSNIGGVASAPILAAAYNKSLVGVGVLMAIMGYLIGTFGGLFVGNIMIGMAQ